MKRYALSKLLDWKSGKNRKPLIVRGARQVGKTWLMKKFGETSFKKTAYINFENNQPMQQLFEGDFDIQRLITAIQIESDTAITPNDSLIILDEIQEAPRAVSSLKYFNENASEYAIVAAGSLLGVAVHQGSSFPVGKVDFLDLHPLSFTEFVEAVGRADLLELIRNHDWQLVSAFNNKYIDLLRQYYYIGGMPEAVNAFVQSKDFEQVRKVHNSLLAAYEQDFSKHAPGEIIPRIRMLWESVPAQLARENRKFTYSKIRQGARARDFELAMQWLFDCGLLLKVNRVNKPGMPLSAYYDNAFKLFMLDVGLLAAKSGLDKHVLLEGSRIFEEFKGSLTEQYVLQQMVSDCNIMPYYWSSEQSQSEIDFVFQNEMNIYPLEVKSQESLKAKSLKYYSQKYQPEISIRTSMADYRKENWLINLPLYAISELRNVIAK